LNEVESGGGVESTAVSFFAGESEAMPFDPRANPRWIARYIRGVLLRELAAYEACVTERLLRSFGNLSDEVDEMRQRLLDSIEHPYDHDDASKWAESEAETWAMDVWSVHVGICGLLVAGLFHTFEQHASWLCVEGRVVASGYAGAHASLGEFETWLGSIGVAPLDHPQWIRIKDELRLVANVVKHAEGTSANQLRRIQPSLFQLPGASWLGEQKAYRPLFGSGLHLSEAHFQQYAAAVRDFWSWLADRFDTVEYR